MRTARQRRWHGDEEKTPAGIPLRGIVVSVYSSVKQSDQQVVVRSREKQDCHIPVSERTPTNAQWNTRFTENRVPLSRPRGCFFCAHSHLATSGPRLTHRRRDTTLGPCPFVRCSVFSVSNTRRHDSPKECGVAGFVRVWCSRFRLILRPHEGRSAGRYCCGAFR